MAHEVETQDGIVIRGIPDDIPPDSPIVKAKVAKARAERDSASVTADMSGPEKFLAGVGMGMSRVGRGLRQITGLTPQSTVDEAAPRDAALSNTGAGMAGDIVGNLALTAVPGMGVGGLAAKGAAAVLPAMIAPTVAAGATGAGISAATVPVPTGDSRAREAGIGFLGGAGGDIAARGLARVAQPIMQSDAVKRLLGEGIVPTPGQAAGADSLLGRTEQKAQSIPLVGDIVKSGRDRAAEEFRLAALNRANPPGAPKIAQAGQAGMDDVNSALSKAYDRVFAGHTVQPESTLAAALDSAKHIPALPLNAESQKTFDAVIKKSLWQRIPQSGVMDAQSMKAEVIGDLGKVARDHLNSPLAQDKALGEALMEARNSAQKWLVQSIATKDPAAAAQIAKIDPAYRNHIALEKSTERARGADFNFRPNQLQATTKPGDSLRGLANDAQEVLSSRVPNSGTVDRALIAAALGGGGGVANEYYGGPHYLSALALAPLAYSRAGSRYAVGNLIPGQSTMADLARRAAPATAQGGRALNEAWQNRPK